jgi:uncharacterized integral membrane protein
VTTPQQEPAAPATGGRTRSATVLRSVRTTAWVVLAVLTTVFLLGNSQTVEVNFLLATVQTPLFVALSVALILGIVLALGAVGLRRVRTRRR